MLTTPGVSAYAQRTLSKDGWRVLPTASIANPGKGPQPKTGFPSRFWGVYTKLAIFNLTEYQRGALRADLSLYLQATDLFGLTGSR